MASNFWLSSQCNHWLLSKRHIERARAEDRRYASSDDEVGAIAIWCSNVISALTKRLNLRQRVTATACVFFRRFYSRPGNSYASTDPALVATACIYVAAKVEETPVHVRSVVAEASRIWTELGHRSYPNDVSSLAEMEFYLLEELDFHLVVHHPYRALLAISGSVGKNALAKAAAAATAAAGGGTQSSGAGAGAAAAGGGAGAAAAAAFAAASGPAASAGGLRIDVPSNSASTIDVDLAEGGTARGAAEEEMLAAHNDKVALGRGDDGAPVARLEELDDAALQMAWFVLNDTYRTDIPLLYPPHIIAVAAVYLALVLHVPSRECIQSSIKHMEARRQRWKRARDEEEAATAGAAAGGGRPRMTAGAAAAGNGKRLRGVAFPTPSAAPSPSAVAAAPSPTGGTAPASPAGLPSSGARGWASLPMRPAHLPVKPGSSGNMAGGSGNVPAPTRSNTAGDSPSNAGGGLFGTPPPLAPPQSISGSHGGGGENHHAGGEGFGSTPSNGDGRGRPGAAPSAVPANSPQPPAQLPPLPAPPPDALTFLAALNVNLALVAEVVQDMIASYELWHRVSAAPLPPTPTVVAAPFSNAVGGGGGGDRDGSQAEGGESSVATSAASPAPKPSASQPNSPLPFSNTGSGAAAATHPPTAMISDGPGMLRRIEAMRQRRRDELVRLAQLAERMELPRR